LETLNQPALKSQIGTTIHTTTRTQSSTTITPPINGRTALITMRTVNTTITLVLGFIPIAEIVLAMKQWVHPEFKTILMTAETEEDIEEKIMVDYSEAFLELDHSLRAVYEAMLKGRKEEAVELLEKISDIAKLTAAWIESNDNYQ
jgi:hypothetical protein